MSKKLILIRHSTVEKKRTVPSRRWRLSADGHSRAAALTSRIVPFQPNQIVTSTEPKAYETGQIMANLMGVPCTQAQGLHEHDRTNVPFIQDEAAFNAKVFQFFHQPQQLVFGKETAAEAQQRIVSAVNNLMTTSSASCIAIVTHGTVLTLFATYYCPHIEPVTFWKGLPLPCAFITAWPDFDQMIQV